LETRNSKLATTILSGILFFAFSLAGNGLCEELLTEKPSEEGSSETPVSPKQSDKVFRGFGIGMYVAAAGDAASTEWGLSQPGVFERNPLMANQGVRLASHVIAPTVVWWSSDWLRKQGHGRSALLLRVGMTAGYTYLTLHNIYIANRN
jgi:hypothetical protein